MRTLLATLLMLLSITRPLRSFVPRVSLLSRVTQFGVDFAPTDAPSIRQTRLFSSQGPPKDMTQEEIDRAREERKAVSVTLLSRSSMPFVNPFCVHPFTPRLRSSLPLSRPRKQRSSPKPPRKPPKPKPPASKTSPPKPPTTSSSPTPAPSAATMPSSLPKPIPFVPTPKPSIFQPTPPPGYVAVYSRFELRVGAFFW